MLVFIPSCSQYSSIIYEEGLTETHPRAITAIQISIQNHLWCTTNFQSPPCRTKDHRPL